MSGPIKYGGRHPLSCRCEVCQPRLFSGMNAMEAEYKARLEEYRARNALLEAVASAAVKALDKWSEAEEIDDILEEMMFLAKAVSAAKESR
jgi:hypothetical protein